MKIKETKFNRALGRSPTVVFIFFLIVQAQDQGDVTRAYKY